PLPAARAPPGRGPHLDDEPRPRATGGGGDGPVRGKPRRRSGRARRSGMAVRRRRPPARRGACVGGTRRRRSQGPRAAGQADVPRGLVRAVGRGGGQPRARGPALVDAPTRVRGTHGRPPPAALTEPCPSVLAMAEPGKRAQPSRERLAGATRPTP